MCSLFYCLARRADGGECRAFRGKNSDFCLLHDPARREQAKRGRKLGGKVHGQALHAENVKRAAAGGELGDLQTLAGLGLQAFAPGELQVIDDSWGIQSLTDLQTWP